MIENPLIITGIINSSWAMNLFIKSMTTHKFVNYGLIKGILDKTNDVDLFINALKQDIEMTSISEVNVLIEQHNEYKNKLKEFLSYQYKIRKNREESDNILLIEKTLLKELNEQLKNAISDEDYIKAVEIRDEIQNLNIKNNGTNNINKV